MNENIIKAYEGWEKETKVTSKQKSRVKKAWFMWINGCGEKMNHLDLTQMKLVFSGFLAGFGFGLISHE